MIVNKINLYRNKDIIKLSNRINDKRGFIQPISDFDMKSASIIYTKKKQWRANHYHKKDWHFIYVIKGSFEYYFRKTGSNGKIKKKIIKLYYNYTYVKVSYD